MKKSEMITDILNTYHSSQRGGMSEMSDYERMERILNRLEELGMLPPIGKVTVIPDPKGGFKHSETKRAWDEEV